MKAALYTGWAFPDDALLPLAREAGLTHASPGEAHLLVGWSLGGLRALRDAANGATGVVLESTVRNTAAQNRALTPPLSPWEREKTITLSRLPRRSVARTGRERAGVRDKTFENHSMPVGIVLISSGARFCADGHGWPGTAPAALRALQQKLRAQPDDALRGFHRLTAGEDATETLVDERCRASLAHDLHAGLRELASLDLRADAPRLAMPTLILHGACDRVFPVDAARATAQLLPRATLHIHPEAGHDLPLMQTAWCAEQIRNWMDAIA